MTSLWGLIRRFERTAWTINELSQRAPEAVNFLASADQAYQQGGWKGVGEHLTLGGGWRPGARMLHPALEQATDRALMHGGMAVSEFLGTLSGGEIVEAEPEVMTPPWQEPLRALRDLKYGLVLIFGEKGWGKTTLAWRLAYTWHKRLGYPVDAAGVWQDDLPAWAHRVSMKRIVARMHKVGRYLDQEEETGVDDGLDADDLAPKGKSVAKRRVEDWEIEAMSDRIVVIDEGHLFFSGLTGDQAGSREAATGLQNQLRHLRTPMIVIIQKQSETPRRLKTASIQLFKPAGEQFVRSDYRQGEKVETQRIWMEVLSGLAAVYTGHPIDLPPRMQDDAAVIRGIERCVQAHRWYGKSPWQSKKSWSYLIASDLAGRDYRGPIPNTGLSPAEFSESDEPFGLLGPLTGESA